MLPDLFLYPLVTTFLLYMLSFSFSSIYTVARPGNHVFDVERDDRNGIDGITVLYLNNDYFQGRQDCLS